MLCVMQKEATREAPLTATETMMRIEDERRCDTWRVHLARAILHILAANVRLRRAKALVAA